jgi:putative addiction module component
MARSTSLKSLPGPERHSGEFPGTTILVVQVERTAGSTCFKRGVSAMATTVDRVLGEALKLAPRERARIVAELLASLEPDVPSDRHTDAEWIDEIERRARAAIAGNPGVPLATAFDQIQNRLSRH